MIPEGNAALLTGPDLRRRQLLAAVDGVAGVGMLAAGVGLAWAVPGRRFLAPGPELRGVHGGPRNRAQVAVAGGGHPALAAITAAWPPARSRRPTGRRRSPPSSVSPSPPPRAAP